MRRLLAMFLRRKQEGSVAALDVDWKQEASAFPSRCAPLMTGHACPHGPKVSMRRVNCRGMFWNRCELTDH